MEGGGWWLEGVLWDDETRPSWISPIRTQWESYTILSRNRITGGTGPPWRVEIVSTGGIPPLCHDTKITPSCCAWRAAPARRPCIRRARRSRHRSSCGGTEPPLDSIHCGRSLRARSALGRSPNLWLARALRGLGDRGQRSACRCARAPLALPALDECKRGHAMRSCKARGTAALENPRRRAGDHQGQHGDPLPPPARPPYEEAKQMLDPTLNLG